MTEMQQQWSPNWADRLVSKLHALGYANVTDLLEEMPGRPYKVVSERLGDVNPVQIISIQFREARLAGRVREAAKDSLVRNLVEQLPNGWGIGGDSDWQSVRALSSWSSEIQVSGECENVQPKLLSIARALRELPPPSGWKPSDPSDPIIESVFELEWS